MKSFLIISLLFIANISFSQSGLGALRGNIRDVNRNPLEAVTIKLYKADSLAANGSSDADGMFQINSLTPGYYSLVIEDKANEYVVYRNYKVIVSSDRITFLDNVVLLKPGETHKKKKRRK